MTDGPATPTKPVVGRLLGLGFGLVSLVAVAMCGMLVHNVRRVGGLIDRMTADEGAIRSGLELAMAVREQYIHQAHSMIEGDRGHLQHYDQWVARIEDRVTALSSVIPERARGTLDRIARDTAELDRVFRQEALPAMGGGDASALAAVHGRIEALAERAAKDADAIVVALESRMSRAHVMATDTTQLALWTGGGCALAVVALAVFFTWRIRRAVLVPLATIAAAATRFGRGEFDRPIGDVGKGELGAVSLAFDRMVAELRERERRLLASERMAAIGQLAAGVAHEINNPIGVIRGYLRTMLPEAPTPALRGELEILEEEAAACQRIADDLLAYARAPDLTPETVPMEDLLARTATRFVDSGEAAGVHLRVDVAPGSIVCDGGRIRQVMLNLLRNAVQASPVGGTVQVEGRAARDGGYRWTVCDEGDGVRAEDRERIFEPFFSERAGGSGLGLAVCQGIVGAHGGRISVRQGEGGRGACFEVVLPPRPSADGAPQQGGGP